MFTRTARFVVVCSACFAAVSAFGGGGTKHRFSVTGSYVEGCTCGSPCKCELTGVEMGCEGVGAFSFTGGSFDGKSIAGVKTAYATKPGEYVVIYIDAPTATKRAAAEGLMRAALGGFGKIEAVKKAKVAVWHKGNMDYATVDGGKIMNFKSQSILGGDGKTPLTYGNIHDPIHPVVMQGKTLAATFNDGSHQFELKDSNAFFQHRISSKGSF